MNNIDDLVASPYHYFGSPREVLSRPGLTLKDRRRILESWKLDAERLADSSAENMTGGEETNLSEVAKVLINLKSLEERTAIADPRSHATAPHITVMGAGLGLGAFLGAAAGLVVVAAMGVTHAGWPAVSGLLTFATLTGALFGGVAAVVGKVMRS